MYKLRKIATVCSLFWFITREPGAGRFTTTLTQRDMTVGAEKSKNAVLLPFQEVALTIQIATFEVFASFQQMLIVFSFNRSLQIYF